MEFLLDVIFIAVAIAFIIAGAKKGLVKALLDGLSTIVSGIISYVLSKPVAEFLYESIIRGFFKDRLKNALTGSSGDLDGMKEKIDVLVNELPEGAVNLAAKFGFNINAEITGIIQTSANDTDSIVEAVMINVADSVLLTLTEAVTMISLFIAVSVLLVFVIRLLNDVTKKIPVVKETNKLAGGFLGLLKAVVLIFVASTVLFFVAGSSNNEELVTTVNSSKIFEFVNNNNPLLSIFN